MKTNHTKDEKQPDKCPECGGEADNGFDRCLPPNPYYCTKCENNLSRFLGMGNTWTEEEFDAQAKKNMSLKNCGSI